MKFKNVSLKERKVKLSQRMLVIVSLISVVVLVLVMNILTSASVRDKIDVVTLKEGVLKDGKISESNLVMKKMIRSEFESYPTIKLADGSQKRVIAKWEERKLLEGTYAQYYLREGCPIYWDSLTKTVPRDHAYLYQMDGELLRIDEVDPFMFGELLVPGDKINVRVSYTDTDFKLPTEDEFNLLQQTGLKADTAVQKQDLLFAKVTVIDVLNKSGGSIFDEYYKILEMPKKGREALVNSKEFKDSVKPSTLLLVVTPEEVERYMHIKGMSPTYTTTLLPREHSNILVDALEELHVGFKR